MPTVYIIQDSIGKNYIPALKYGAIKFLVPQSERQLNDLNGTIKEIDGLLVDFSPDKDFVIPTGDPALIALVGGYLMLKYERLTILRWDRQERVYVPVTLDLRGCVERIV